MKIWLKTQHSETEIMASGPNTSQQIDGETVETVSDFNFLGPKITTDGDCSHEIKSLATWKKRYDLSRQHIKKQRHYFADKCIVRAMFFFFLQESCTDVRVGP